MQHISEHVRMYARLCAWGTIVVCVYEGYTPPANAYDNTTPGPAVFFAATPKQVMSEGGSIFQARTGENKDASTDDFAHSDADDLPPAQHSFQLLMLTISHHVLHGLVSSKTLFERVQGIGDRHCGIPKKWHKEPLLTNAFLEPKGSTTLCRWCDFDAASDVHIAFRPFSFLVVAPLAFHCFFAFSFFHNSDQHRMEGSTLVRAISGYLPLGSGEPTGAY